MTQNAPYPAGSVLAEMKIDIYASKKREDLWIMHDRPFAQELKQIIFEPDSNNKLHFAFADGTVKELGAPLRETLAEKIIHLDTVLIYQMDVKKMQPLNAQNVPVKIKAQAEKTE